MADSTYRTNGYGYAASSRGFAGRLMAIFAAVYLVQSIASPQGFAGVSLLFYQLDVLQLTAGGMATLGLISSIGWYIKPVFGLLSDSVPIFGYRRLSYLVVFSIVACLSWVAFSAMGNPSYVRLVVLCTIGMIGYAFADVANDGLMVETGQRTGMTGRFQATAWSASYLGAAAAATLGGIAAERLQLWSVAAISAAVTLVTVFVPVLLLREPRSRLDTKQFRTGLSGVVKGAGSWPLWICLGYLALWYFSPLGESVMGVQQVEVLQLDPKVLGYIGGTSGVALMFGCLIYWSVCRRFSLQGLLAAGALLGALSGLSYLALVSRESLSAIASIFGVTGDTAPSIGALIVFTGTAFVAGFGLMPTFDLAARACPVAAEGTIFASLMAITNLSQKLSNKWGAGLFEHYGFTPLVFISAAFTALCVPLVMTLPGHLVRAAVGMAAVPEAPPTEEEEF